MRKFTEAIITKAAIMIIAALSAFITTPHSHANTISETRIAIDQGDFTRAAAMGQSLATADGFTLAAEALAAPVLLGIDDNPKRAAKAAYKFSQAAIELDPSNVEAHMQAALALGFITRASNPISVWRKGLATDLKEAIDAFELLSPNDARVQALRGAWHYGIVRKAGQKRAQKWYEASLVDGDAAYEAAITLAPNDIIIKANYALSLVDSDYQTHKDRARAMLDNCIATTAQTAIERAVQERMKTILKDWDNQKFIEEKSARWLDGK